jgi:hypothetical protein
MRGLVALSLLCVALVTGCGVFVGFVSNPGAATTVNGTVTVVHLIVMDSGKGTSVNVTAVTLVDAGKQADLSICGDHVGLFPLNQFVRVNLTTGTPCSTLMAVVVVG